MRRTRLRTPPCTAIIAAVVGVLSPSLNDVASAGQLQPTDPTQTPALASIPQPVDGLEWVILDPLGARFAVPQATQQIHKPSPAEPHLLLRDGQVPPTWSLRVEIVKPTSPSDSPARDVLASNEALGQTPPASILAQGTRQLPDRVAHEAWVRETLNDGAQVAFGWLAVPRSDGAVMLFTAVTTPQLLSTAKPVIEQIFDSITPIDTPHALAGSTLALQAGAELLSSLEESQLRSLQGFRRVIRISRPTMDGLVQELGYGVITAEAAPMDAVRPDDGGRSLGVGDEDGLLVTVHLRYAIDPQADKYLDQIARLWMAWDQSQEQWYLNSTRKQRGLQAKETEFGIRAPQSVGQPRPTLVVIRQGDSGHRSPFETEVPPGWLPRPLEWLMLDLAPRRDGQGHAWAAWDHGSGKPRLLMRRDHWTRAEDGTWLVRTWEGMDGLPTVSIVGESGPLSIRKPDGTRIDVIDDRTIAGIWQAAGLRLR
jgi:hypothetical protein